MTNKLCNVIDKIKIILARWRQKSYERDIYILTWLAARKCNKGYHQYNDTLRCVHCSKQAREELSTSLTQ